MMCGRREREQRSEGVDVWESNHDSSYPCPCHPCPSPSPSSTCSHPHNHTPSTSLLPHYTYKCAYSAHIHTHLHMCTCTHIHLYCSHIHLHTSTQCYTCTYTHNIKMTHTIIPPCPLLTNNNPLSFPSLSLQCPPFHTHPCLYLLLTTVSQKEYHFR